MEAGDEEVTGGTSGASVSSTSSKSGGMLRTVLIGEDKEILDGVREWFFIVAGCIGLIIFISCIESISEKHGLQFWIPLNAHSEVYSFFFEPIFFLGILAKINYHIFKSFRGQVKDQVHKDLGVYLSRSTIAFENAIQKFDYDHLIALENLLKALNSTEVNEVFSIDNSEPLTWWSETMIGYLAVLANWKSLDTEKKRRAVGRVFVCPPHELVRPVLAKTLALHKLMGFETIVYSQDIFNSIFTELKNETIDWVASPKEVLVWRTPKDNPDRNHIEVTLQSVKGDEMGNSKPYEWQHVNCYQSFWDIDSEYAVRNQNERKTAHEWENYYHGHTPITSVTIKVWFEFVGYLTRATEEQMHYWRTLPKQYWTLIETLRESASCTDESQVREKTVGEDFGLTITTADEDEISKALSAYYRNSNQRTRLYQAKSGHEKKNRATTDNSIPSSHAAPVSPTLDQARNSPITGETS